MSQHYGQDISYKIIQIFGLCTLEKVDSIVWELFSRESDSTFTNVCLSVRPSVCQEAKPLNSLNPSSFIIQPSSFIHSSFIPPSFRDF